jgi:hypothetical protein
MHNPFTTGYCDMTMLDSMLVFAIIGTLILLVYGLHSVIMKLLD